MSTYELEIVPRSTLPMGEHEFLLHLSTRTRACHLPLGIHEAPTYSIPVRVSVVPRSYILPEALILGVQRLGDTIEKSVVVGLRGQGGEFTVTKHVGQDGSTEIQRVQTDAASTDPKVFTVVQSINQAGANVKRIQFLVELEDGEQQSIDLPISYFGLGDQE